MNRALHTVRALTLAGMVLGAPAAGMLSPSGSPATPLTEDVESVLHAASQVGDGLGHSYAYANRSDRSIHFGFDSTSVATEGMSRTEIVEFASQLMQEVNSAATVKSGFGIVMEIAD